MSTNTAPLRASCDRCRAQKLRCVPSSEDDATAPCQRCLRSKSPKSCTFSRRSRMGRCLKISGSAESQTGIPRKEKEAFTPTLPGMSAFVLSSISSSQPEPPDERSHDGFGSSSRSKSKLGVLDLDDRASIVNSTLGETVADLWETDNTVLHLLCQDDSLQQPPNLLFEAGGPTHPDEPDISEPDNDVIASLNEEFTFDVGAYLNIQETSLLSPPYSVPATDMDVDMDMLEMPGTSGDKPGPLVNLTMLLAKMSHYENQLSKFSGGGELDNYPIGDALFFSQRFYTILSDYGQIHTPDSSSHLDMPIKLLTLSCYMTLTRLYSSVFGYLHRHLSQLHDAHEAHEAASKSLHPVMADIHAYRGLRLGQLQSICMCSGREPATRAKKAVSMLLGSLGGSEGVLGLPSDVRVIANPRMEAQAQVAASPKGSAGERMVLFEEGLMAGLMNGRLYKTVREHARELRAKIEEVDDLLKGLLEM